MAKGCAWHDFKCLTKGTPLGGLVKALDEPWKKATAVAASALKGVPIVGGVAAAVSLGSQGKINEAYVTAGSSVVKGVANITGLDKLPFVSTALDAVQAKVADAVVPSKKAGGAADPRNQLSVPSVLTAIVSAIPQPPATATATTFPVAPPKPPTVPQNLPVKVAVAAKPPGKVRVFSRTDWKLYASKPDTVGGTQPAG